jgi:hypothetical protein
MPRPALEEGGLVERKPLIGLALGSFLLIATPAPAQERARDANTAPGREAPAREARPEVDLDDLLKLPESMRYDVERRGGATRGEWKTRFLTVRTDLEEAQGALARAQTELEHVAGSADAWKLSPPGGGAEVSDAPLDFRLRQEIRRQRSEVERLEKRLLELDIEANLAGVPQDWRD